MKDFINIAVNAPEQYKMQELGLLNANAVSTLGVRVGTLQRLIYIIKSDELGLARVMHRLEKRKMRLVKCQWMEIVDRRKQYEERLKQYMSAQ